MLFKEIVEEKDILKYLMKRNILEQYKKSKIYLLLGLFAKVNFGLRQPKNNGIFYFRINKQYRAYCIIENNQLRVIKIDNHQN